MNSDKRTLIIAYICLVILGITEFLLIYGIHNYLGEPILLEKPARSAAR